MAFLADRFALAAGKIAQEVVETIVAAIVPMELMPMADHEAHALQQSGLIRIDEIDMGR